MSETNYSTLEKLLHRLALNYESLAEFFFDLDQQLMVKRNAEEIRTNPHVFISGLARAGTTVLMRRFYSTGNFRSLTYRDMPFVLAPNLWKKLTNVSRKDLATAERAHGDSLKVDADSPESLDEVFWRVFCGDLYLKKDRLVPHKASREIQDKFVAYINSILTAQDGNKSRYLSKNNNNILRLTSIASALPNAIILIPFRDPLQHSQSLAKQHQLFTQMQGEDAFTLSYMTWLSHHEFGLGHRPFCFSPQQSITYSPDSLDYWLSIWVNAYQYLLEHRPEQATFVCYEKLCENPAYWEQLAAHAKIPVTLEDGADTLKLSRSEIDSSTVNCTLLEQANSLYEKLGKTFSP